MERSRFGRNIRRPALVLWALLLAALPAPALSETTTEAPTTVQVRLEGFTLAPALAADGTPERDESGEPVILRVPLEESVITPGDQVLYLITLDNPTAEPALDLTLTVQLAAEVQLDPFSFAGPEGLVVDWADAEDLTEFRPIFVEVDGQTVMQADLESLRALRLTLPELPPSEQFSVEYTVTLR